MKHLFQKIVRFFKTEMKEIGDLIDRYGERAVLTLEYLKAVVDSPTASLLTSITKTRLDDNILSAIRFALDNLLPGTIPPDADFQKILLDYLKQLKAAPAEVRAALYLKISSLIIRHLASLGNETLTPSEADTVAQLAYLQHVDNGLSIELPAPTAKTGKAAAPPKAPGAAGKNKEKEKAPEGQTATV